jgi:hypothetical protein
VALEIEDGTNVAGANSYATREEIIAYSALRGVVVADADASDVFAIKAMDYIESQEFKGNPTYGVVGVDQGLQFPRDNIAIGSTFLANDEIPVALVQAQCEAAMLVSQGIELNVNRAADDQGIKRDKTGPMETEYFAPPAYSPTTPRLDALLAPLIVGFGGLKVIRA